MRKSECFVVFLAFAATAAAQRPPARILERPSYFPLEPGRVWVYELRQLGSAQQLEVWAEPATADPASPQSGTTLLHGYFPGEPRRVSRLPGDIVVEFGADHRAPGLWYMLAAPEGFAWRLRLAQEGGGSCIDGAHLTIWDRHATVTVPYGQFENVVVVRWETGCADGGITVEYFAPGVGLIRREELSFSGSRVWELVAVQEGRKPWHSTGYGLALALENHKVSTERLSRPFPPQLRGLVVVFNFAPDPVSLVFPTGCPVATLHVLDHEGKERVAWRAEGPGCCLCPVLLPIAVRGVWPLPFAVPLVDPQGVLPAGSYLLRAVLETVGPEALRPAAQVGFQVVAAPSTQSTGPIGER